MKKILILLVVICSAHLTIAQTFTKLLSEGQSSPQAEIESMKWLAGHWTGAAFGGIAEEVWTPPSGGSMMCAFKLVVNEKVSFYEIVTISEVNRTLILRLKHFHNDLKGWEEKDETVDFELVDIKDEVAYFEGFTIEKIDDDHINMYVQIGDEEKVEEVKFAYSRKSD